MKRLSKLVNAAGDAWNRGEAAWLFNNGTNVLVSLASSVLDARLSPDDAARDVERVIVENGYRFTGKRVECAR